MKKMAIFLLSSVFVYGVGLQAERAELQVDTPVVQVDSKEKFPNVAESVQAEFEEAQFVITVPVDLDPIAGRESASGMVALGGYSLACSVKKRGDTSIKYRKLKIIQAGNYTAIFKFDGIPKDIALKINSYSCDLRVKVNDGDRVWYRRPDYFSPFESTRLRLEGTIE